VIQRIEVAKSASQLTLASRQMSAMNALLAVPKRRNKRS